MNLRGLMLPHVPPRRHSTNILREEVFLKVLVHIDHLGSTGLSCPRVVVMISVDRRDITAGTWAVSSRPPCVHVACHYVLGHIRILTLSLFPRSHMTSTHHWPLGDKKSSSPRISRPQVQKKTKKNRPSGYIRIWFRSVRADIGVSSHLHRVHSLVSFSIAGNDDRSPPSCV